MPEGICNTTLIKNIMQVKKDIYISQFVLICYLYLYCGEQLNNKRKEKQMYHKKRNVVYDNITNYGITIKNNVMYLIKDGKTMKLSSLIIKGGKGIK